jgi:hypothetical protein
VIDNTELLVVAVEDKHVITRDVVERGIVFGGEQGPPGPTGPAGPPGSVSVEANFAFGDATPATVTTALAGKLVYGVEIYIKTPFDGAGAQIVVGDAAQSNRLMAANENDLLTVGGNHSTPAHAYAVDTPILLGITPGAGATQGAGVIVLRIQQ